MSFIEYFEEYPCRKCESYSSSCSHHIEVDDENTAMMLNRFKDIVIYGCGDCFIAEKHYERQEITK